MKKIKVKPVQTLEIALEDRSYVCYFNMLMVANMQELLSQTHLKMTEISPARMVSMILQASINAGTDEPITKEEAVALAVQMDPGNYNAIMDMYFNSIMDSYDEKDREQIKKAIALQIATAMKSTSE